MVLGARALFGAFPPRADASGGQRAGAKNYSRYFHCHLPARKKKNCPEARVLVGVLVAKVAFFQVVFPPVENATFRARVERMFFLLNHADLIVFFRKFISVPKQYGK